MRVPQPSVLVVVLLTLSSAVLFAQPAQQGPTSSNAPRSPSAPVPMPASLDEASVVLIVGDVQAFLTQLGSLTELMDPMMSADALRVFGGAFLSDPGLTGFSTGSGVLVAFFPVSQTRMVFAEIVPAQLQAYRNTLAAQGRSVDTASGLLVAGENARVVAAAKRIAAQAKETLDRETAAPTLKIIAHPSRYLTESGGRLPTRFRRMRMWGGRSVVPLGREALQVAARDMDSLSVEFVPSATGGLVNLSLKPRTGSTLAKLLAAPAGALPSDLPNLLPAKGALRAVVSVNPQAVEGYLSEIAEAACAEANGRPAERDALLSAMKNFTGNGAEAFAVDMLVPGRSSKVAYTVARSRNSGQAIERIERSVEDIRSGGAMKSYEDLGLKTDIQFDRNVRDYKGIPVHRFTMSLAPSGAQRQSSDNPSYLFAMQRALERKYEVAAVGNVVVTALGGESVDGLIEAAMNRANPSAKPLASRSVFTGSPRILADLDAGILARWVAKTVEEFMPGAEDMAAGILQSTAPLAGASPIIAAVYFRNGAAEGQVQVPADLLTTSGEVRAAVRERRRQNSGQGQTRPGGQPARGTRPGSGSPRGN